MKKIFAGISAMVMLVNTVSAEDMLDYGLSIDVVSGYTGGIGAGFVGDYGSNDVFQDGGAGVSIDATLGGDFTPEGAYGSLTAGGYSYENNSLSGNAGGTTPGNTVGLEGAGTGHTVIDLDTGPLSVSTGGTTTFSTISAGVFEGDEGSVNSTQQAGSGISTELLYQTGGEDFYQNKTFSFAETATNLYSSSQTPGVAATGAIAGQTAAGVDLNFHLSK